MKKIAHLHCIASTKSEKVEKSVRKIMKILTEYQNSILDCKVKADQPRDAQYDNLVYMRIYLTLAGNILGSCELENCSEPVGTPVIVRNEYLEMSRKLENKYMEIMSDSSNPHDFPVIGEVTEVFQTENYGRITTMSGRKSYFLRSSFLEGDFDKIKKGTVVEFNEEVSPFGTLATSVRIITSSRQVH